MIFLLAPPPRGVVFVDGRVPFAPAAGAVAPGVPACVASVRADRDQGPFGDAQRFNPKFAYAKKKITDGTLGKVVSVMVSRHLSRGLGTKIAKRVKLSPVVMESTHDLDFVFWLLEPAKPVRVYSQGGYGYMQPINGSYDVMWSIVTMDNGMLVTIGGGWNLPPGYPNFC